MRIAVTSVRVAASRDCTQLAAVQDRPTPVRARPATPAVSPQWSWSTKMM